MPQDVPSKSQVKKAGSRIRKFLRGDGTDLAVFNDAIDVLDAWRAAHATPLVRANNGLRSRAKTINVTAKVTQRLKRKATILDKLRRESSLDLSRMRDIGGCRAVVAAIDDLRRLETYLLSSRLPVVDHIDYIENPRISGYRGVHIVVEYDERAIEIQLRSTAMHAWALKAEELSETVGLNVKQDGDHPIQLFLQVASEFLALQEAGGHVPIPLLKRHEERRLAALPYLERGPR